MHATRTIRFFARFWFRSQFSGACLTAISFLFASTLEASAQGEAGRNYILYATSGSSGTEGILYTLDPATAAVLTTVGPVHDTAGDSYGITGFKYDSAAGLVYGVTGLASPTNPNYFVVLDPATALVTPIGPLGANPTDITIDPKTGVIYALSDVNEEFYTIDTATGQAIQIGSTGIDLTRQGGLVADRRGALLGVTNFSFYRFSRKTGKAMLIGPTHLRNLLKAADLSPSNVMYGLEGGGGSDNSHLRWLVTFDVATGRGTRVGQINANDLGAIAFVPVTR